MHWYFRSLEAIFILFNYIPSQLFNFLFLLFGFNAAYLHPQFEGEILECDHSNETC